MFRDDASTISMGLVPFWTPAQVKPCPSPARQAKASTRTLYASLWHCSSCEQDVRIYATLTEALAGDVRTDCPSCGRVMQKCDHVRQSHASACSEIRQPEHTAAWAA
jgi:predicted RNA-binding Zn-ribbon protein involved in translation (DUF1610 family)